MCNVLDYRLTLREHQLRTDNRIALHHDDLHAGVPFSRSSCSCSSSLVLCLARRSWSCFFFRAPLNAFARGIVAVNSLFVSWPSGDSYVEEWNERNEWNE